jgi:hypothetical protein
MVRRRIVFRTAFVAAFFLLLGSWPPGPVAAQTSESGFFFGGGLGLGNGTMSVGSSSDSKGGLTVSAQFGTQREARRRWVADLTFETFKVPNAVRDEYYRAVTLMAQRALTPQGSPIYVSPALGFQHRTWSGPDPAESSDIGLAIGGMIGGYIRLTDRLMLMPEAGAQWSGIELEGSVGGSLIFARVYLLVMPGG